MTRATLAPADPATLGSTAMATINFDRAKQFIAAVPEGRWTAYGDVADAAGNRRGAMAIGMWLLRSGGDVPFFWRVLTTKGHVPDTLRGGGIGLPHDAIAAREVLRKEGVEIDFRGRASQHQRFRPGDWAVYRRTPTRPAVRPPVTIARSRAPGATERASDSRSSRHVSDSVVQRSAETAILAKVAEHFGTPLAPRSLTLSGGARVQIDGVATDDSIFVEVFARQGSLKGGQQKKVSQDALKLVTIARDHPDARLVLAFADAEAATYAARGTWVSEALATWGVTVLVVDIDEQLRANIKEAQVRQIMVNPSAASPTAVAND
jgi:alkylated DNA nucleotide flippase Atl1